ncbi:uncharacterized protein LOC131039709 [Cryptomeria japonica]|uniref:uncharacterized protein LOC131039709 n=1 Tax=Cryptomeria japonica TaxID=3369 RepID=UPI0025AD6C7E|nr:uncharacterized protein LOC131039709 [Cryptomeria japonica]
MFQLVKKLGFLKSRIKDWNVMHFKNIFGEKARIQEEIEQLNESIIASGLSLAIYDKLKLLNLQLSETLAREESYWRQKSRDLWLFEGDRNTKFFHSSSKLKRLHNRISCIHDSNGNTLIDEDGIAAEAVRFFKSLLSVEPVVVDDEFGGFLPGWKTPEGVIVAHEILHSISQQKVLAMILKLDMLKAYDRVNWQSLVAVLYRFGFSHSWVKWVFSCIRVDGLPSSQSHCLFADDTLLFGMASMREARVIKKIISDYAAFSGQKVPSQLIKKIKVSLRTFLWSDNLGGQTKIPLLAWDKICRPKEVGGAGIRDLVIQNKALGAKLIWKLYANPRSKWASVMLAKYLRGAPNERIFTATSLPKGFAFWNFLISCMEVILPHLSWVVHNGKKAHFWDEVWNGHLALSAIRDWSPLLDILSDLWGPFVADYFNIVTSGPCLVAKWKDIPPLSINNDIMLAFIEKLRKRPLLFHMKEDSLVWVKNATGSYSVKEGYNSLVQAPLPSCWPTKLFWHPACLPKVGAFAWLAVQDKVLTGMRLDRLGITTVFPCVFCGYYGVSSTLKRKMAKWSPPPFPSLKLQFDGASKGNPWRSGIGVIIFDHSSKIIKVVGKYIGHATNNVAEFQALSFELDLARSLNIKDIVIEGDSMLVFQAVARKKCLSWHLQYFLEHILLQLNGFSTFSISHCFREINAFTDFLANKAVVEGTDHIELAPSDFPISCMKLLS